MKMITSLRERWEMILERFYFMISIGRLDLCPQTIPVF